MAGSRGAGRGRPGRGWRQPPRASPNGRGRNGALPSGDRRGRPCLCGREAAVRVLRAARRPRLGGARAGGRDRARPRPARARRRQARRRARDRTGVRSGPRRRDAGPVRPRLRAGSRRLHRQPAAGPRCPGAADRGRSSRRRRLLRARSHLKSRCGRDPGRGRAAAARTARAAGRRARERRSSATAGCPRSARSPAPRGPSTWAACAS